MGKKKQTNTHDGINLSKPPEFGPEALLKKLPYGCLSANFTIINLVF